MSRSRLWAGSLSAYFSDAGWDCTLLDISESVLNRARDAFLDSGLSSPLFSKLIVDIPLSSDTYDVIFSIGLLEHFEDCLTVVNEQFRCLAPVRWNSFCLCCSGKDVLVQRDFDWFNTILSNELSLSGSPFKKESIYRSSLGLDYYKSLLLM